MSRLDRWFARHETVKGPIPDKANCEECNWAGVSADCETGWDQEGWENPEYEVAYCPKCGESSVVFHSTEEVRDDRMGT